MTLKRREGSNLTILSNCHLAVPVGSSPLLCTADIAFSNKCLCEQRQSCLLSKDVLNLIFSTIKLIVFKCNYQTGGDQHVHLVCSKPFKCLPIKFAIFFFFKTMHAQKSCQAKQIGHHYIAMCYGLFKSTLNGRICLSTAFIYEVYIIWE